MVIKKEMEDNDPGSKRVDSPCSGDVNDGKENDNLGKKPEEMGVHESVTDVYLEENQPAGKNGNDDEMIASSYTKIAYSQSSVLANNQQSICPLALPAPSNNEIGPPNDSMEFVDENVTIRDFLDLPATTSTPITKELSRPAINVSARRKNTSMKDIHIFLDNMVSDDSNKISFKDLKKLINSEEVFIKYKEEKIARGYSEQSIIRLIYNTTIKRLSQNTKSMILDKYDVTAFDGSRHTSTEKPKENYRVALEDITSNKNACCQSEQKPTLKLSNLNPSKCSNLSVSKLQEIFIWNDKLLPDDSIDRSCDWAIIVDVPNADEVNHNLQKNFQGDISSLKNLTYYSIYAMNSNYTMPGTQEGYAHLLVLIQVNSVITQSEMRRMVYPLCGCKTISELEKESFSLHWPCPTQRAIETTLKPGSVINGRLVDMKPLKTKSFLSVQSYAERNFIKCHGEGEAMSLYQRLLRFVVKGFFESSTDENLLQIVHYASKLIFQENKSINQLEAEIIMLEMGQTNRLRHAQKFASQITQQANNLLAEANSWMETFFPWQKLVYDFVCLPPNCIEKGDRIIHFIIDGSPIGGAGKTKLAQIIANRMGKKACYMKISNSSTYLFEQHEACQNENAQVIIYDFPRNSTHKEETVFQIIEQIKDQKMISMNLRYESIFRNNLPETHIIVFTQQMPNIYKEKNELHFSSDRIIVYELTMDQDLQQHVLQQRKCFGIPIDGNDENLLKPNFMERMLNKVHENEPYLLKDESCYMCFPQQINSNFEMNVSSKSNEGAGMSVSSIDNFPSNVTYVHSPKKLITTAGTAMDGIEGANNQTVQVCQNLVSSFIDSLTLTQNCTWASGPTATTSIVQTDPSRKHIGVDEYIDAALRMACNYEKIKRETLHDINKFLDEAYPNEPKTSCSFHVIRKLIDTEDMFIRYKNLKFGVVKSKSEIISLLTRARRRYLTKNKKQLENFKNSLASSSTRKGGESKSVRGKEISELASKVAAEIQPSLHCTVKVSTSSDEGDGETIKIDWDESSSD